MPLPQIVAATTPSAGGRRVFVSYSHLDADLAEAFMRALRVLAGNMPELCLAPERIFYDRAHLKAGDDWNDVIKSQLLLADVFLLLVSNHSLDSRYCLQEELHGAAVLGIPIVPVLLSTVPAWDSRPIEGDPLGRRLGALNAVPINGKSGLQPIRGGNWATRDQALTQAMQQIAARLVRDAAPLQQAAAGAAAGLAPGARAAVGAGAARGAARPPQRVLAPLLPNYCNQQPPEDSFESGLDRWRPGRALLVLVKGEFADDTTGFWERLCSKNLVDFCELQNLPLGSPKSLELPRAFDAGQLVDELALSVRRRLSEALFLNARRLRSGADLAALLAAQGSVLPLCTTLPDEPAPAAAALLGALLALIEDVPADAPLDRLVIAVMVENPLLVADPALASTLQLLGRFERCDIVETRRLQPLTTDDVMRWHRHHDLTAVLRLDEGQLVDRLFAGAATLRHRPFDQLVRPLLGLAAIESLP